MSLTRWYVHVWVVKGDQYAEHKGMVDIDSHGGPMPTPLMIADQVTEMLLRQSPHLRGGQVTVRDVRKR